MSAGAWGEAGDSLAAVRSCGASVCKPDVLLHAESNRVVHGPGLALPQWLSETKVRARIKHTYLENYRLILGISLKCDSFIRLS